MCCVSVFVILPIFFFIQLSSLVASQEPTLIKDFVKPSDFETPVMIQDNGNVSHLEKGGREGDGRAG
jgi:hypothetical protein